MSSAVAIGHEHEHGREAIRENLRAFVDRGFTAHHDVAEFWDGGRLNVFRGFVTMTPDDPAHKPVRPAMTQFFYMDEQDPTKDRRSINWGCSCAAGGMSAIRVRSRWRWMPVCRGGT
jgi:hypothetical protein